jgi:hypothetical protein
MKASIIILLCIVGFYDAAFAHRNNLEKAFTAKMGTLELMWKISMNRVELHSLDGELHADHWDHVAAPSKTVKEVAGLFVSTDEKTDLINFNMGDKTSVSLYFNTLPEQKIIGRFHTHPYEYESLGDLPFSPRDFVDLYLFNRKLQLQEGYFSLIKSGKKYFAMVVVDADKARSFFAEQEQLAKAQNKSLFDYLYKKFYSINHGRSIQEIQLNSLRHIMGSYTECGVELLEADESSPVWTLLN